MSTILQSAEVSVSAFSTMDLPDWFMPVFAIAMVYGFIVSWRIYSKCGEPGWACLIPFYNIYVYCRMVQRPKYFVWMIAATVLGMIRFAPLPSMVGILIAIVSGIAILVLVIMLVHALSRAFGQGAGFTLGLIFLGIIFYSLLAFGNYQYVLKQQPSGADVLDA